jgi:signal transduction histidine kinase
MAKLNLNLWLKDLFRKEESLLTRLLQTSQLSIWELNYPTQMVTVAGDWLLSEVFPPQLLWPEFLDRIHWVDRGMVERKLQSGGAGSLIEFRLLLSDVRWIQFQIHARTEISLLAIARDITTEYQTQAKLVAQEKQFRRFVEANMFGVVYVDVNGKVLYANDYFFRVVGDPVVGSYPILDSDNWDELRRYGCCAPIEKYYLRDGESIPLLMVAMMLESKTEAAVFFLDLTQQKKTEERLQQALQAEQELSELKSRFINTVCHEYRTPLTSIYSSSEILEHYRHQLSEEKQVFYLKRIQSSVYHLTQLVEDVLFLGKADSGHLNTRLKKIDLIQFCELFIREEVNFNSHLSHFPELKFSFDCSSIVVSLDELLFRQILSNLVSNAIKYSLPKGVIEIHLSLDVNKVLISIRDYGIGIPEDELDKIFEPFYRCSSASSISGTGLGLAIVKRAVETLHGSLKVESELGKGSTFTVILPLKNLAEDLSLLQS